MPGHCASVLLGIGLVAAASGAFNQLIERRTDASDGSHGQSTAADRPIATGGGRSLRRGLRCGRLEPALFHSQRDNGLARGVDAGALRRRVHAAQKIHGAQHGGRSDSRGAAPGSRLDRVGGGTRLGRLFAVCRFVRLAVSAFSGDRLALPPRLSRRPGCGCCRAETRRPTIGRGRWRVSWPAATRPFWSRSACCPARWPWPADLIGSPRCLLSLGYLAAAVRFVAHESRETARGLLYSSLVYLPTLLAV